MTPIEYALVSRSLVVYQAKHGVRLLGIPQQNVSGWCTMHGLLRITQAQRDDRYSTTVNPPGVHHRDRTIYSLLSDMFVSVTSITHGC